jgi:2-polyprenyl-3-methyl-5-hydroxy-6-metoxy-1,4-benzoquinol methylase
LQFYLNRLLLKQFALPGRSNAALGEPINRLTEHMDETYFRHIRRDIEPLLPRTAIRILDVGCGVGATAAWLKSRYPGSRTVGLEGNPSLREELSRNVDEAHIVDLDGTLPDVGAPDLVLFLDVLEHLARPEQVLAQLTAAMPPEGTVIVSLPNVAHLSVSLPLLLRARFTYRDAGILDRTHLRFFVRQSAVALLNGAGFTVQSGVRAGFDGPRTRWLDRITFGKLRDCLTKQYIMAGRRALGGSQGDVAWRVA